MSILGSHGNLADESLRAKSSAIGSASIPTHLETSGKASANQKRVSGCGQHQMNAPARTFAIRFRGSDSERIPQKYPSCESMGRKAAFSPNSATWRNSVPAIWLLHIGPKKFRRVSNSCGVRTSCGFGDAASSRHISFQKRSARAANSARQVSTSSRICSKLRIWEFNYRFKSISGKCFERRKSATAARGTPRRAGEARRIGARRTLRIGIRFTPGSLPNPNAKSGVRRRTGAAIPVRLRHDEGKSRTGTGTTTRVRRPSRTILSASSEEKNTGAGRRIPIAWTRFRPRRKRSARFPKFPDSERDESSRRLFIFWKLSGRAPRK